MVYYLEAFALESPELMLLSYVYMPDFEENFLMFNFDNLEKQYTLTSQWAKTHDQMPMGDFLLYNLIKKK